MTDAWAFRGYRFPAVVILWAVRWYLQFPISYPALEAMLADRGIAVGHVTVFRWIRRSPPNSSGGCGGICGRAAGRGKPFVPRRSSS